jgi:LacI family transcriptional regulator
MTTDVSDCTLVIAYPRFAHTKCFGDPQAPFPGKLGTAAGLAHAAPERGVSVYENRPGDSWPSAKAVEREVLVKKHSRPSGIKEIAKALGIAIATVDRALHARSGVSPKTRAKVLKMAEQLHYKPNVAAASLKLNRRLRIGVYLPLEIRSFFDPLRAGVRSAADAMLGATVELDFRTYPRLGEGDAELLGADATRHFDGIVVTPGNPATIGPLLQRFVERGIAVVCVASDAPRSKRLSSISVDASVSGGIAAELMAIGLQKPSSVATITGDLHTLDHAEKLRGFAATLATIAPHLALLPAIEGHERQKDSYKATLMLLSRKPHLAGIYINTANSLPVLSALEEHQLLGKIQVVTTDLFPELVPLIEAGKILATIYQRLLRKGE